MKKLILICGLAAGVYIAVGIYNLLVPTKPSAVYESITVSTPEAQAAKELIGRKCIMCHSSSPVLPFYAKLPLAGRFIQKHVKNGISLMNLQELVAGTSSDRWAHDRLRYVVENNTMPLGSYLLLHWNGKLTDEDRGALLAWIEQEKAANQ